jgi:hypothetical protein
MLEGVLIHQANEKKGSWWLMVYKNPINYQLITNH